MSVTLLRALADCDHWRLVDYGMSYVELVPSTESDFRVTIYRDGSLDVEFCEYSADAGSVACIPAGAVTELLSLRDIQMRPPSPNGG